MAEGWLERVEGSSWRRGRLAGGVERQRETKKRQRETERDRERQRETERERERGTERQRDRERERERGWEDCASNTRGLDRVGVTQTLETVWARSARGAGSYSPHAP